MMVIVEQVQRDQNTWNTIQDQNWSRTEWHSLAGLSGAVCNVSYWYARITGMYMACLLHILVWAVDQCPHHESQGHCHIHSAWLAIGMCESSIMHCGTDQLGPLVVRVVGLSPGRWQCSLYRLLSTVATPHSHVDSKGGGVAAGINLQWVAAAWANSKMESQRQLK